MSDEDVLDQQIVAAYRDPHTRVDAILSRFGIGYSRLYRVLDKNRVPRRGIGSWQGSAAYSKQASATSTQPTEPPSSEPEPTQMTTDAPPPIEQSVAESPFGRSIEERVESANVGVEPLRLTRDYPSSIHTDVAVFFERGAPLEQLAATFRMPLSDVETILREGGFDPHNAPISPTADAERKLDQQKLEQFNADTGFQTPQLPSEPETVGSTPVVLRPVELLAPAKSPYRVIVERIVREEVTLEADDLIEASRMAAELPDILEVVSVERLD